ncbi:hypothetical protein KSF_112250 [Reticulibacter mediterranei]|uniref:Uncharacterized protein n=1 Tax=Reticulibacter mediterranei TaxID=2778369 RepID=A0A8J3NB71_9CHLR|nr:hypothetical protein [Reticulibacter mediterranei]GHP01178.1 hypothetical protein KSF_112250 [Reticulibacter mediterranei]
MKHDPKPTPGIPQWVKIFVMIVLVLVLLLLILHLTGNGFGNHMGMSIRASGGV